VSLDPQGHLEYRRASWLALGGTPPARRRSAGAAHAARPAGTPATVAILCVLVAVALLLAFARTAAAGGYDPAAGLVPADGDSTNAFWYWQNPQPAGNWMGKIDFSTADTIWAVGDVQTVIKSTDGGVHWTGSHPGGGNLHCLEFVDEDYGWVAGNWVMATTDGGATWTTQSPGIGGTANDIFFVDHDDGWIATNVNQIISTTDGGAHWTQQKSPLARGYLAEVDFVDEDNGWLLGIDNYSPTHSWVFNSTNGGESWTVLYDLPDHMARDIEMLSTSVGYFATDTGLLRTTDGGAHWTAMTLPANTYPWDISFSDEDTGFLSTGQGTVLYTDDGCDTWSTYTSGRNESFRVETWDGTHAATLGTWGSVAHTQNGTDWALVPCAMPYGSPLDLKMVGQHGLASGSYGGLYATADGGLTWTAPATGHTETTWACDLLADGHAWTADTTGRIRTSSDYGATWSLSGKLAGQLRDLKFLSASVGWVVGDGVQGIFKTTDGGATWTKSANGGDTQFMGIDFSDDDHGIAVGYNNKASYTSDGGQTWTEVTVTGAGMFNSVDCVTPLVAYAGGWGGGLWKTTDGGATWTKVFTQSDPYQMVDVAFRDVDYGAVTYGYGVQVTTDGGTTWTNKPWSQQASAGCLYMDQAGHLWGGSYPYGILVAPTPLTPPTHEVHHWTGGGSDSVWSNAANWQEGFAPSSGDSVVFSGLARQTNENDITGLTLKDITIENPRFVITGKAVGLTGTFKNTTTIGNESEWYTDIAMDEAVTFDAAAGTLKLFGTVSGGGASGGLTKTGTSTLDLCGQGTWAGATNVNAGYLDFDVDDALPSGSAVAVAAEATAILDPDTSAVITYDNVFSGPAAAKLKLTYGMPKLTADSSAFAGTVELNYATPLLLTGSIGGTITGSGMVCGTGTAGAISGGVMPLPSARNAALSAFSISELTGASFVSGTYQQLVVAIADATGAAGAGFDVTHITGNVDLSPATGGTGVVVLPLSIKNGIRSSCTNFDATKAYRWPFMRVDGTVSGFNAAKITTTDGLFINDTMDGVFTVELTDHTTYRTLDLVFTPYPKVASGPTVGDGGAAFVKGSTQRIAWTMNRAPDAGAVFKVVADDTGSAVDVLLDTVAASSATDYHSDWSISQGPSPGWKVRVELWSSGVGGAEVCSAESTSFDIVPGTYTITVTAGAHGSVTPGTGPVTAHADATYTITPDAGYHIATLTVDGDSKTPQGSWQFPNVTEAHSIAATFAIDTFPITVTAGANGSITPAGGSVDYGSSTTYAITPDGGYVIATLAVDGVDRPVQASWTFSDVKAAHSIAATFAPIDPPTTTVSGLTHGWSRRPVTLTFTGHLGPRGVAVAFTEYQVDDGPWVRGDTVTISDQGETRVAYRSQNAEGAVEQPAKSCRVRIDGRAPRVRVARVQTASGRRTTRLAYRVSDYVPGCGHALVRLRVTDARGRVVRRASSTPATTNARHTIRVRTRRLAPGTYRLIWRAVDAAGNAQRGHTVTTLRVP
jgi:autotransporter-associated beta strand protein